MDPALRELLTRSWVSWAAKSALAVGAALDQARELAEAEVGRQLTSGEQIALALAVWDAFQKATAT